MSDARDLTLAECLLLLALHDEKGTPHSSMFPYAIGGAILADLLLRGRIAVQEDGRSHVLAVKDATQVGDAVLDECLREIQAARPASLEAWLGRLAEMHDLRERL